METLNNSQHSYYKPKVAICRDCWRTEVAWLSKRSSPTLQFHFSFLTKFHENYLNLLHFLTPVFLTTETCPCHKHPWRLCNLTEREVLSTFTSLSHDHFLLKSLFPCLTWLPWPLLIVQAWVCLSSSPSDLHKIFYIFGLKMLSRSDFTPVFLIHIINFLFDNPIKTT